MFVLRAAVLLICLSGLTQAAKILLLASPSYSHCREVSSIGEVLAANGHQVKIFLGSKFDHKNCFKKGSNGTNEITPIIYEMPPEVLSPDEIVVKMSAVIKDQEFSLLKNFHTMFNVTRSFCKFYLCNKDAIMALKKEQFDLAIVDCLFFSYCSYAIPHVLDIPFVSVSTFFEDFITGRPFLPSIVPNPSAKLTDRMTFMERIQNIGYYIFINLFSRIVMPTDIVSEYIPGVTVQYIHNYISKSELFIYNYDTVLAYPVPTMPNHVLAGGLGTFPAKPLEGELKQIYSQSANGVVVLTFGGSFGLLPAHVEDKFFRVLKRLKTTVVWRYPKTGRDGDVIRLAWLPQNDLLGDSRTKLFISHCGNNGVFEALYHGVPILCTPLVGDQLTNAMRIEHWNAGRYANMMTSTEDELFDAISEVLNNNTYRHNMQKASAIFHSRPFTPKQRAAFWVEHVLKFGGEHLRSRATEMNTLQYLGYDLLLFVVVVLCGVFVVLLKLICFCYRRICKAKLGNKVKTN